MSRHSKNNTANPVFTHYEKSLLKYGTQNQRLGKDSLGEYDSCKVCLHPVVDPLACLKGHLFCKQCIVDYLITHSKLLKQQQAKYEQQQQQKLQQKQQQQEDQQQQLLLSFKATETATTSAAASKSTTLPSEPSSSSSTETAPLKMNAFWLPSMTPTITSETIAKPQKHPNCPAGDHPIRLKKLVKIQFTPVKKDDDDNEKKSVGKYQCPLCSKTLTNTVRTAYLAKCGHVYCSNCVQKFVTIEKKCSVCNISIGKDKDIVQLKTGGTGFASHGGEKVQASVYSPSAWL